MKNDNLLSKFFPINYVSSQDDVDNKYIVSVGMFYIFYDKCGTAMRELLLNIFANEYGIIGADYEFTYNHLIYKKPSINLSYSLPFEEFVLYNNSKYYTCNEINKIIWYFDSTYYHKWKKLYDTFISNYNYLDPYNMITNDDTNEHLQSNNSSNYNYSDNNNITGNSTNDSSNRSNSYGVVSSPIPSNSNANNTTSTLTQNNTDSGQSNNNQNYSRDSNFNRILSRSGNIGNKTKQELTIEQRELLKTRMCEYIFEDLEYVFTSNKFYFD